MVCQVCKKECKSLTGLHGHFSKAHKLSVSDYYHSFYPRYDLNDKELIDYKTYKQYFESDFNSRDSFVDWLADHYKDDTTKEYCIQKIKERMTRKCITTLPGQVELKSLMLPSISGFEKIYGNLDQFIQALKLEGVKLKFDYNTVLQYTNTDTLRVFVDTREQRPLNLNCPAEKMKLSCGDYCPNNEFYSDVFIERKDLSDLAGTLAGGLERFEKEIVRAKDLGFYLVVLAECLYSDALHYTANTSFSRKMNGPHLFHVVRELSNKYDNIQFVFSGTRKRASELVEKIFSLKGQVKTLDLEFLKDRGKI